MFSLFEIIEFYLKIVRTKVSTWVSNFVTEMRIKSPAVVQKWVESIPNDKSESILFATNESIDSKRSQCEENFETLLNNKEQDELEKEVGEKEEPHPQSTSLDSELIKDNSSTETPTTKFWPKIFLSSAFSRTNLHQSNEVNDKAPAPNEIIEPKSTNSTSSILSKSKINEFYNRLSVNKKRYSFIKERRMEAKKILDNAKDRFLSNSQNDISDNRGADLGADVDNEEILTYSESVVSSALAVYDNTIEMEVSTDDFSHLSQSNDNMSADDSFNLSTQSINDRPSSSLLNVGRKIAIGEIGRSTSDNPRLRNKFHLGDIGRSFSEHQDDEAIIIGERNISAPTSSIAIQNNNKSNGSFFERRAYSVSPTQRSLKRGVLSRDHSLSDSPRNRNILCKDSSFQSDSSHCSSVESLLDARKPDPEAILRHLGFGPIHQEDLLSRIPKRYTKFQFKNVVKFQKKIFLI